MPGIAGFVGRLSASQRDQTIAAMTQCLHHDASYRGGRWNDDTAALTVGWTAHADSMTSAMPFWNEDKTVALVLTGEPIVDRDELLALRRRGHHFSNESAAYVVHMYEERGLGCLRELDGWFSGVLTDLRAGSVTLFTDRYGLGRIYYHSAPGVFYFATEAKSLLSALPILRKLDLRSVGEFWSCGCALQNRTLFTDLRLLPGAAAWTLRQDGSAAEKSYFVSSEWEEQSKLDSKSFTERLRELFPSIMHKYVVAPGRLGMSLTGGLDGRMIMATAKVAPGAMPCYSFGSVYRTNTDSAIAGRVARICGQSHEIIKVDSTFLAEFPQLAERSIDISDGAMDVTAAVELYVNRRARAIAPVRMTGNYGSEIMRGNVAFGPGGPAEPFLASELHEHVRAAAETYAAEARCHPVTFIAFRQVPWHHYSRLSIEQSQLTLRSPFLDRQLVALMYQAPRGAVTSKLPSLQVIDDGNPALARIPTDRGLLLHPTPVWSAIMHQFQEIIFKAEYAFDYGMPDWLCAMPGIRNIERQFLGRHKFYHFRTWYRDQLAGYVRAVLLDPATLGRSYFNGAALEKMVQDHLAGQRNATTQIHSALWLELVNRRIIEGRAF